MFLSLVNTRLLFYTLTDSEFTAEIAVPAYYWPCSINRFLLVAKEYEKRKKKVAANLALYYKYAKTLDYDNSMGNTFDEFVQKELLKFPEITKQFVDKYADDIRKWLMMV